MVRAVARLLQCKTFIPYGRSIYQHRRTQTQVHHNHVRLRTVRIGASSCSGPTRFEVLRDRLDIGHHKRVARATFRQREFASRNRNGVRNLCASKTRAEALLDEGVYRQRAVERRPHQRTVFRYRITTHPLTAKHAFGNPKIASGFQATMKLCKRGGQIEHVRQAAVRNW